MMPKNDEPEGISVAWTRPNCARQPLPNDATVDFAVNGGILSVSRTGGGDLRVDAGGRRSICIVPVDHSAFIIKIEPI